MKTKTTFTVKKQQTPFHNKPLYNVKVYQDGIYAGIGRFCKTLKDVDDYKRKIKRGK